MGEVKEMGEVKDAQIPMQDAWRYERRKVRKIKRYIDNHVYVNLSRANPRFRFRIATDMDKENTFYVESLPDRKIAVVTLVSDDETLIYTVLNKLKAISEVLEGRYFDLELMKRILIAMGVKFVIEEFEMLDIVRDILREVRREEELTILMNMVKEGKMTMDEVLEYVFKGRWVLKYIFEGRRTRRM